MPKGSVEQLVDLNPDIGIQYPLVCPDCGRPIATSVVVHTDPTPTRPVAVPVHDSPPPSAWVTYRRRST